LNGPQGNLPTDNWIDQALNRLDNGTAAQTDVEKLVRDALNDERLVEIITAIGSTGAGANPKLQ